MEDNLVELARLGIHREIIKETGINRQEILEFVIEYLTAVKKEVYRRNPETEKQTRNFIDSGAEHTVFSKIMKDIKEEKGGTLTPSLTSLVSEKLLDSDFIYMLAYVQKTKETQIYNEIINSFIDLIGPEYLFIITVQAELTIDQISKELFELDSE